MTRRRQHFFNEGFFDAIETPEQAYWLGFMTADGCIHDRYHLGITLQECDSGHLIKFADCIGSDLPVTSTVKKCNGKIYHGARILVSSKRMVESLEHLGITPRKSFTVKPWNGSLELMPVYWRGLFDGDGCIARKKQGQKLYWSVNVVGNYDCVSGFAQWARNVCGSTAAPCRKSSIWQWQTGGTVAPQLLARQLKTSPIGLDRKQKLLEELSAIDFGTRYLRTKTLQVIGEEVMSNDHADASHHVAVY